MLRSIETLGGKTISYVSEMIKIILFFSQAFVFLLSPTSYNRSTKKLFIKQLYLSTIKILPVFSLLAILFGSIFIVITILFAMNFNLQEKAGALIVAFVLHEFAPLFTTLFITLRYRYIISTKRVPHKDLIKRFTKVYVAKLLNSIIAIPSMALLFATLMLIGGYTFSTLYLNLDLLTYKELIISALSLENIVILFIKSLSFGFIITLIPIYFSHKTSSTVATAKSIIDIFVTILIVLFLLEIFFIVILY